MTTNLPDILISFLALVVSYPMEATNDGDALVGMKSNGSQLRPISP